MQTMSNVVAYKPKLDPKRLSESWGWKSPTDEILQLATKAGQAQTLKTGEILVEWNILTAARRDQLLHAKPADMKFLEYCSDQEPGSVLPHVEMILTLQHAYPYYDRLSMLTHYDAAMEDSKVHKACDELNAVLMLVESEIPVLVFSQFQTMLKYSVEGPAARRADPIHMFLRGTAPQLAVGAADDVATLLKMTVSAEGGQEQSEGEIRAWNVRDVATVTSEEERQLVRVLDHALNVGASDVWLKPFRNGTSEIRIRKWGRLIEPFKNTSGEFAHANGDARKVAKTILSAQMTNKAVNLLLQKAAANNAGTKLLKPADGQINYRSPTASAFMRLNFVPLNHLGEIKDLRSVSIRLFQNKEQSIRLADLNIPPELIEIIRDAVVMPQGLILVSGPVNNGKSTTIAGAVGEYVAEYGDEMKILSVEDPIERHLTGVMHVQASPRLKEEERFAVTLRAYKRHDINAVIVGEIRDAESAEFVVRFSNTGHLAFTTTHASDSMRAIEMIAQELPQSLHYLLAEALSLSIAQRLVKRICPQCRIMHSDPTDEERRLFEKNKAMTGDVDAVMPDKLPRANPKGCDPSSPHANAGCDEGYDGEIPVLEILQFTREVKDAAYALLNREDVREQKRVIRSKTLTLLQSGLKLVEAGQVELKSILFFG